MATADASMDLLNAKLKVDNQQFVNPVKAAGDALIRFKTILDSLNQQGNQSSGIGSVIRGIATIGELAKKYFAVDVPQAIGKTKLSLNELASGVGAVRKQVKGLGDDLTTTSRGARQAFDAMAQAAQKAAKASKDSGNAARDSMRTAAQEAKTTGRELVLVGQQGARMGELVYSGARRAAEGVAGLAMTVQRAGQMIASSGMGGLLGGGGMGGGRLLLGGPPGSQRPPSPGPANIGGGGALVPYGHDANAAFRANQAFRSGSSNFNPGMYGQYRGMFGGGGGMMQGAMNLAGRAGNFINNTGGALVGSAASGAAGMLGSGLATAYQAATRAVAAFEAAAQRAASVALGGMRQIATAAGVTAAAVGLITGASVKVAATFEQSMARVKAVTNSTEEEFKALTDEANRLGIVTRYTAREAADAMGFLGLAGYKANDIIKAMPATLDLAAAGMMDTARAADIMAKIMAGMQLDTGELTRVTDILSQAFTNANTDLSQLGEAMKFVGPIGHAAGKSLEEITATLMVLGNNGFQAAMGGTALRNVLSHLAQNGKEVQKVFGSLGVAINDSTGYMRPLADIIDDTNAALKRQGREAETMGLVMQAFGERGGPGMAALLAEGGDAIRKYNDLLSQSAGTGKRIADVQINTIEGSWRLLYSTIEQFQIKLGSTVGKDLRTVFDNLNKWLQKNTDLVNSKLVGAWEKTKTAFASAAAAGKKLYDTLSPAFAGIYAQASDVYKGFMQWFSSLPEGVQDALKLGAAMTIVGVGIEKIGGMIPFVGQFATALGKLVNPLNAVSGAFNLIVPFIGIGGSFVTGILGLIGAGGPITLLIAALVGVGGLAYVLSGDVSGSLEGVGSYLKGAFSDACEAGKSSVAAFTAFLKGDAMEAVGHFHSALGDLAHAIGLDQLSSQLKALGGAEVENAKSGPKLRAKRVAKYGRTGAKHLEIKSQTEDEHVRQSQTLREMERMRAVNPEAFAIIHGESGLQRQRDIVSQAAFSKKQAAQRANDFITNPQAVARSRVGTMAADAISAAPGAVSGAIKRAGSLASEFTDKVKSGFVDAAKKAAEELAKGKAYNDAVGEAAIEQLNRNARSASGRADSEKQLAGIKAFGKQFGIDLSGIGGSDEHVKTITKIQEQARLDFQKQNATSVAQADKAVSKEMKSGTPAAASSPSAAPMPGFDMAELMKAEEEKQQKLEEQRKVAAFALDQTTKAQVDNLGMRAPQGAKAFLGIGGPPVLDEKKQRADANALIKSEQGSVRSTMQDIKQLPKAKGAQGQGQQQQATQFLSGMVSQFNEMMQGAKQASGQTQKDIIQNGLKLKAAIDAVAAAMKNGTLDMKKLDEIVKATGVDMKKLDQAQKDKLAAANGQMTDAQKAAMQQQQQFGQQMQQAMMNAAGQAAQQQGQAMFEGGQAMLAQALGGPGEVQAMIDQAAATGDKKTAFGLIRQRLESQLKISMSNLHNLASDPLAGGGFGPEHGGQSNDAYFMTLDIPIVRLIKFLQAQLNAIPKMAEGGIITKPTQLIAGEAGPEAVIPLSSINTGPLSFLQQLLSGTGFNGMRGGNLTAGALGVFGSAFRNAQYWLSAGMDVGQAGAAAQLKSWMTAQQNASDFLDNLYRYRHIDLSPGSMQSAYGPRFDLNSRMIGSAGYGSGLGVGASIGYGNVTINATFHGTDFNNPSQVRQAANQLYDHLANAARARGRDMSGRDLLRAPGNVGSPNVNAVAAFRN